MGWFFLDGHIIMAVARITTSCAFYTRGGHAGTLQSRWLDGLAFTQDTYCTMNVGERAESCTGSSILLEGLGLWQMCPEGIL